MGTASQKRENMDPLTQEPSGRDTKFDKETEPTHQSELSGSNLPLIPENSVHVTNLDDRQQGQAKGT
jgi:hypothetical protein